jgi:hypothetical protein
MLNRIVLPRLYNGFNDLAALREGVASLVPELSPAEANQVLARLEALETEALRLLDRCESPRNMTRH